MVRDNDLLLWNGTWSPAYPPFEASQTARASDSNTLVAISTPLEATLELIFEPLRSIVAVHGMNTYSSETHAESRWTHKDTGVNWLRSLLPERVPNARILSFQYNANVAFNTSIAGVAEQAGNLLGCLIQKRRALHPTRPMIFIAHSLGGVIVKEALATAFREHRKYPMIWTFTHSIFFLAVPHRGSTHATWGQVLANICSEVTIGPQNSYLQSVTERSRYNEELNARFGPLHEAYKFYSWVEGLPLGWLGMIVPKDSAVLLPEDSTRERVRVAQRNHKTICKFSGVDDPEWVVFSHSITEAAHAATTSFDYSPTMSKRAAMFEPRALATQDFIQIPSLKKAIDEAQTVLTRIDAFRTGKDPELQLRQHMAEFSMTTLVTLVTLLVAVIAPLLILLSWGLGLRSLGNLTWRPILAVLPSKEEALGKARQGQEAQEKIIEVEAWAIEKINAHQRAALRAFDMVRLANNRSLDLQSDDEVCDGQLTERVNLIERKILEAVEFTTLELHARQKRYEDAKVVVRKIEKAREEAIGQNEREFWISTAERVQRERDEAAGADGDGGWWCSTCVIL